MTNRKEIAMRLQESCKEWFKGCACHPEPHEIQRLHRYMRHVMLPTYYPPVQGSRAEDCLEEVYNILSSQIHRALFRKCFELDGNEEHKAETLAKTDTVIETFPALQTMLLDDVQETYNGDPAAASYDEILLTYPGLAALAIYRLAHVLYEEGIPLLPRMVSEYGHRLTGIDIHPGASIGQNIMIDHGTGIVIGETAVVGNHVRIYQGVTIGALFFPRDEAGFMVRRTKRHPTVEEGVVLYANATVLGGDTVIGHHSVIGSNAWITESIPPYSKVLYQNESVIRPQSAT